ncbi:hypothetical protein [Sporosarcina sp. YIM B06819]|uniref:hypothetical protein n=1 Tax=Sporosarcina sp. YIM B06819 TaxID=3081769 RepID=UPI00298C121B|nr:hypothetical protein [Sporosarcina sp. YIM B06819]
MFMPTTTEPSDQLVEILNFYKGETLLVSIEIKDDISTEFVIPKMILDTHENKEFSTTVEMQSDSLGKQPSLRLKTNRLMNIKRVFYKEEIIWRKDAFEIKYQDGIVITVNVLDGNKK